MTVVSSASGLLAMLDEDQLELKVHALKNLNSLVDQFWAEISANISSIESLYEDDAFPQRELAALLASKVFYHLGELNDALDYALGAGSMFNVDEGSEYVQTLLAKCIDEYVLQSVKAFESKEAANLDARLVAIVEKMLDKCIRDGQFHQAVGIALECRRLDKLEEAITKSDNVPEMLNYCLRASQTIVNRREFRHSVLRTLVKLYQGSNSPDYANTCQCLMFLDDPAGVAGILDKLIRGSPDDALMAYQVSFDLFENEFQRFLLSVRDLLPDPRVPTNGEAATRADAASEDGVVPAAAGAAEAAAENGSNGAPPPAAAAAAAAAAPGASVPADAPVAMDVGEAGAGAGAGAGAVAAAAAGDGAAAAAAAEGVASMAVDAGAGAAEEGGAAADGGGGAASAESLQYAERLSKLKGVLSGETPINLTLQFLYGHNRSDLQILKNIKQAVEARNSVCHSATIMANALMHAGTTVDTFLRENLDWLSRATNWAKFAATAGLGVTHRGHLQQGRSLMAPYLPQNGVSGSPFSEGGALYALGLIHANHGEGIKQFLLESLRNTSHEVVQHGACLGLGLAAFGTADEEVFEDIKSVLHTDSAVAGEAAGIGMGLLMVGSGSKKAMDMLTYAHDTQHEKIIRGLAIGMALVVYGREEEADTLIEQMVRDPDPILRYGGMYALAMAYRGTANNSAIRRLLHFAVSDVSDDVRRAAVLCLGFVLCSEPKQVPKIVALLSESYNPHVRYGAAMAVGIACAGTAQSDAISLLEPLTSDGVDYVRQGALIAMAMVLMQASEAREPKVGAFRRQLEKTIAYKHEDTLSKMGAIVASGVLDAGGRNVTIALRSRTGHDRVTAIVGCALFTHSWYWHPLVYFLSLAFAPTAFVGLNMDLKMPKLEVVSDARPSLFAYPPPVEVNKVTTAIKAPTAILSTAARAKSKAKKEAAEKAAATAAAASAAPAAATNGTPAGGETSGSTKEKEGDAMEVEGGAVAGSAKKESVPETTSERLANPARVVPTQEKYIKFPEDCRYRPLKSILAGMVMLQDLRPTEPEELVMGETPAGGAPAAAPAAGAAGNAAPTPGPIPEEEEPSPPEPFEYVPSQSS